MSSRLQAVKPLSTDRRRRLSNRRITDTLLRVRLDAGIPVSSSRRSGGLEESVKARALMLFKVRRLSMCVSIMDGEGLRR